MIAMLTLGSRFVFHERSVSRILTTKLLSSCKGAFRNSSKFFSYISSRSPEGLNEWSGGGRFSRAKRDRCQRGTEETKREGHREVELCVNDVTPHLSRGSAEAVRLLLHWACPQMMKPSARNFVVCVLAHVVSVMQLALVAALEATPFGVDLPVRGLTRSLTRADAAACRLEPDQIWNTGRQRNGRSDGSNGCGVGWLNVFTRRSAHIRIGLGW